jgi:IS5 family transposase
LIVDATCTPADIRYPNDMSILNEARENTERFIDFLYESFRSEFETKPRDYRKIAHRDFIAYTKKRKPRSNVRRKAIRKQLNYLKRNIRHIESLLAIIDKLDFTHYNLMISSKIIKMNERHEIIQKVYSQQLHMHINRVNRVDNRIVSITQPHIRPIVRGKAGKAVEFGAKISLSLVDGFSFVDNLSWDSFNESKDLIPQIEKYMERFGYYPASVHADKIYQTRENRKFCKDNDIRITGKPLGRPAKETEGNKEKLKEEKRQRYQDDVDRIAVEGCFGVAKRKYGLGLIKSKLRETSETDINLSVLVLNLDKICSVEIAEINGKYNILKGKAS